MLKTPARNAIATARPVRMSGVARTSVPDENAYHDPKPPFTSAASARSTSVHIYAAGERLLAMRGLIARIPKTEPIARIGNAQRQPTRRTTGGTSWIDTIVNKKPSDVCTVSAVPTAWGGTDSVTSVLNCAESAIT